MSDDYIQVASGGVSMNEELIHRKHHFYFVPFLQCGKIFHPVLPLRLSKKEKPVVLGQLTIDIEEKNNLSILLNFSCFITSILKEGKFNNLTFRLTKTDINSTKKVLREWPFRRSFVNDTNIKEPLVYNYCEYLHPTAMNKYYTYTMELVEVKLSEKSSYNISQKSMTAQVFNDPHLQGIY